MAQMFKTTIMISFRFQSTKLHQITPKDTKTLKSQTVTPKEHGQNGPLKVHGIDYNSG